jgi:PAS domain S-box-containing protein
MKDWRGMKFSTWCVCALVIVLVLCLPQAPGARQGARILLINSYHNGFKWSDDIVSGVRSVLGKDEDLRIEYMDARRISTPEYLRSLRESFRIKFRDRGYDVVIVSDDPALDLMLDLGEDLFPSTPVVFCGINNFSDARLMGKSPYSGVVEEIDIKDTLEAAHTLHPTARKVIAPVNSNVTGVSNRRLLESTIPAFKGIFEFEIVEDPELDPFLERLKGLRKYEYVILLTGRFRSSAGEWIPIETSTPEIAKAGIPVYSMWEYYLGHGIIGGMLTNGFYQGKTAGEIARRILRGEKDIPVVRRSPNRYAFDFRQLELFGVEEDLLPAGSVVVNKPVSFYARHTDAVHAGAGIVLFCLAVITFLSILVVKKNRAERELRRYQDNLEVLVEERTERLNFANAALTSEIKEREQVEAALRESEEKYRVLIEKANEGVLIVQDETLVFANPRMHDLAGVPAGALKGRPFVNLIWPDDRDMVMGKYRKRIAGESVPDAYDFRLIGPEGAFIWVFLSATTILWKSRPATLNLLTDISDRKRAEEERERLIVELQDALSQVRTLSGLLPICASCKRIRNEEGNWEQMEAYIRDRSEAKFSHGICPECAKKLYADQSRKK